MSDGRPDMTISLGTLSYVFGKEAAKPNAAADDPSPKVDEPYA